MAADFIRNLAAFAEALGIENAPTVFAFSTIPWVDDRQRNEFIKDLTNIDIKRLNTYAEE